MWIVFLLATLNPFVYCYFGKSATESFLQMADSLYEANWIERSVVVQKYFLLAITNAQRPLFYHGYGIAVLNLDTFTKVSIIMENECERWIDWICICILQMLNKVFSYYMMFKAITTNWMGINCFNWQVEWWRNQ